VNWNSAKVYWSLCGSLAFRFGEHADRGDQLNASSGLRDEAMSPGAQYVYESRRFMDREEDNFRIGGEASDFQGRLCTTQNRHIDVEENDVRLEFEDLVDGFLTVLRLTADLKAMPIQKRADRDPCRLMIVNNKDSCWHRLRPVFRYRNGGPLSFSEQTLVCTIQEIPESLYGRNLYGSN